MKVRLVFAMFMIFASLFSIGCTDNEVKGDEVVHDKDSEVRKAVLDYMEQEDWHPEFYSADKWEKASVKKVMVDDRYKNIDKTYIGREIFAVTIANALAAPTVFVDPDSLKIIGVMPGE